MIPALFVAALAGCSAATPAPGEDADVEDAEPDAPEREPVETVDILLLVDPGCAGPALRYELERTAGALVRELLDPGPDPQTGEIPPPVRDLHVGITTMSADMSGYVTANCTEVDDGRLNIDPVRDCELGLARDCEDPPCPWLSHSEDAPDLGERPGDPPIWEDLACLVRSEDLCACGWNQPLEAALRALTVRQEPGEANEGFLRDESVLALVFLSDGDDCSVADTNLFDPEREDLSGFPARCVLHPEMLRPVQHYVDALRGLRPAMDHRTVVAVFGGFPPEDQWRPGDSVEALRAWVYVDPEQPNLVASVCEWWGGAGVYPPPRLVELAYGAGDGGFVISSICGHDWDSSAAMSEIARTILRAAR